MNINELIADEDAVSPVIGVILMVAITVILAAVIGTFVLGLGDQVQNTSPQASFTFDFDSSASPGTTATLVDSAGDGDLDITHDGGDKVKAADLAVKDGAGNSVPGTTAWSSVSDVTAGDTATVGADDDDTIRVIWNPGSDNSATLGKWTGPNA